MKPTSSLILALFLAAVATARAEVKLPAVFGDHMVLQRHALVPVWGTADPGEVVTVTFADQKLTTEADKSGKWMVKLRWLRAGGPYMLTVASKKGAVKFQDVLVGEVWVCSGQSNMEMSVGGSNNAQREIADAVFSKIRLFTVKKTVADSPQSNCEGQWAPCSPETVGGFSAVGYFFGRDLHRKLNVPIGLIHTSWGGTPAEAWTSQPGMESDLSFAPIRERWQQSDKAYPRVQESYSQQMEDWKREADRAKLDGKPEPKPPKAPDNPHSNSWRASGLFNGMIAPLIPFAIQGAIWYQGESNAGRAFQYRTLFPAMISSWRTAWGQGNFPFLFVQLANFTPTKPEPDESDWAELREAQTMTLALKNTGQAVIIDIGDAKDIHPKNKQDVGHRLALAAESIAYDSTDEFSGPMYKWMSVRNGKVIVRFTHAEHGLVAKGGGPLKGFAIAGADKKFVWANARIRGSSVEVWSDKVPQPVAVRYAWANNPECNLYNKADLPASPFRTDTWPGVTVNAK